MCNTIYIYGEREREREREIFFFFFKGRPVCVHQFHFLHQDHLTVAQQAGMAVDEHSDDLSVSSFP